MLVQTLAAWRVTPAALPKPCVCLRSVFCALIPPTTTSRSSPCYRTLTFLPSCRPAPPACLLPPFLPQALDSVTTPVQLSAAIAAGRLPPAAARYTDGTAEWVEFQPPAFPASLHDPPSCSNLPSRHTQLAEPGPAATATAAAPAGAGAGGEAADAPRSYALPRVTIPGLPGVVAHVAPVVWFRWYDREELRARRGRARGRQQQEQGQGQGAAGAGSASSGEEAEEEEEVESDGWDSEGSLPLLHESEGSDEEMELYGGVGSGSSSEDGWETVSVSGGQGGWPGVDVWVSALVRGVLGLREAVLGEVDARSSVAAGE